MGPGTRRTGEPATIRPARAEDLDELVDHTWSVAAEGRWTGIEVPFDREARRGLLDTLSSGFSSTVLVADTAASGGPGIVGYI
jgi:ribosomal protein S18 acetylase RimI-like enzyme